MRLDEVQMEFVGKGITHLEDLSPQDFLNAIQSLNSYEITEKIDGAALQFGIDNTGKFFTSRTAKGGHDYYNYNDWGQRFSDTGFKSAHLALENYVNNVVKNPKTSHLIERGERYAAEILFGKLPNTVPYTGETNQIILLGKVNSGPDDRQCLEKLNTFLENKKVTVEVHNIPYTDDGIGIQYQTQNHNWGVAIVPEIRTDVMKKAEAQVVIDDLVAKVGNFLDDKVQIGAMEITFKELIALQLNKKPEWLGDASWKEVKEIVKPLQVQARQQLLSSQLEIKDILLQAYVAGVRSSFGPSLQNGGWIEGVVAKGDNMFKIVDRDAFTSINKYNWLVRSDINSAKGSVWQDLKKCMAQAISHPKLATSYAKQYINSFGQDGEEQITNLAGVIDFEKARMEWLVVLNTASTKLDAMLTRYKEGDFDVRYDEEVNKRTLQQFAETGKNIRNLTKATEAADCATDLATMMWLIVKRIYF